MIRRLLAVVAGVAAFGIGVASLVDPGLGIVSVPTASVVFVGLVPLILAYRVLVGRYRRPRHRARTGDPESAAVSRPPGGEISETAAEFLASEYVPTRRGLRAVAIVLISHVTDRSEAEAQAALTGQSWSDDPYAVAFFAEGSRPEIPLLDRLRDRLRPESTYRRTLRHATDAVASIVGVEPPPEPTVLDQWRVHLRAIRTQASERTDGRVASGEATTRVASGETTTRVASGETTTHVASGEPTTDSTEEETERPDVTSPWETGHLRGVSVVALVAGGVGALFREPAIVLVGVIGVGVAAYASAAGSRPPDPSLAVEREIDADSPDPGDTVAVTVTVTNRGGRTLPDVRVIDGVPAALPVVEGSPRRGGALGADEAFEFSYGIEARRGTHEFDPLLAVTRDLAGTQEAVTRVDTETVLRCRPQFGSVKSLPLRGLADAGHGTVQAASGGEGVEFRSVREYRRGDPLRRVDWKRRARTGEFATLEFHEERATRVVCLIDARAPAYVTHRPDRSHAVDRGVSATGSIATTLVDRGNHVGVSVLGPEECWLAPGTGRDHRLRIRELLFAHDAVGPTPPTEQTDVTEQLTTLRRRLRADTQILLFSPLVDGPAVSAARQLDADDYPVVVVSPDPTATRTAPQRLARAVRRMRIAQLRRERVPVVDWRPEERLPTALARGTAGWSR